MNTQQWERFRQTKAYDFVMGLPLIAWFGYSVYSLRPALAYDARDLLSDPGNLLFNLRFFGLLAAAVFYLLLIYLVVVRDGPVRRANTLLPKLCGIVGTYLGVGILHLPTVELSLPWQIVASGLVLLGSAGSAFALAWLGRSFSILPEARVLVTGGPYALARHPLYAVEMITIVGTAIQFAQPWAALLGASVIALLVCRSMFEERVLAAQFPEYESYRARTARFFPGIF